MNKSTIHHIIGELVIMDKYRFVDHALIGEIVKDVFSNIKLADNLFMCKKCNKITEKIQADPDDSEICYDCGLPF